MLLMVGHHSNQGLASLGAPRGLVESLHGAYVVPTQSCADSLSAIWSLAHARSLEGHTASVGEVVTGAAINGAASGAGAAIQAAPRALSRSASSGMSQTGRTATANLLYGIRDATPGFSYSNPTQTAANVLGSAVTSSPDLKPLIEKEKTR